jgi:hypothetical protein
MLSMTGFVSSVVRATGFGFLIGAAFIHRARLDPRGAFPLSPVDGVIAHGGRD